MIQPKFYDEGNHFGNERQRAESGNERKWLNNEWKQQRAEVAQFRAEQLATSLAEVGRNQILMTSYNCPSTVKPVATMVLLCQMTYFKRVFLRHPAS